MKVSFRDDGDGPSYTVVPSYRPEQTVATSPSARTRTAIRNRIRASIAGVSVSISAADLRTMTDSQIQEAMGVRLFDMEDSEHQQTAAILDAAALAETSK